MPSSLLELSHLEPAGQVGRGLQTDSLNVGRDACLPRTPEHTGTPTGQRTHRNAGQRTAPPAAHAPPPVPHRQTAHAGGPASGVPACVGGGKTPPSVSGAGPASADGEVDPGPVLVPRAHATAMLSPRTVARGSRPVSRFHPRMPRSPGANGS